MPCTGCERTAHRLKMARLLIVGLAAMMLAACAQSSVVGNKNMSIAASQRVPPEFKSNGEVGDEQEEYDQIAR